MTEDTIELGWFKITGEIEYTDEEGTPMGKLEIGSVQEVPLDLGRGWVAEGKAEEVEEPRGNVPPQVCLSCEG